MIAENSSICQWSSWWSWKGLGVTKRSGLPAGASDSGGCSTIYPPPSRANQVEIIFWETSAAKFSTAANSRAKNYLFKLV